uniref:2'-5' oligoadenylate synthase n=1 Tax=Sus scrofa TaxID=9823 RepID=A0A8D0UW13_PIG
MGNWGSHLYDRPPQKLGEFVQNNLRPSEDCQKQIDQTVDTICKVLQDAEQLPLVISVARGGSYGRKTVLRGNSDGSLVIFISDLEKFQDQSKNHSELLSQIWAQLKCCQLTRKLEAKMEIQNFNSGPTTIQLFAKEQSITFKILPAFNALGLSEKPSPWTYRDLKRSLDMMKASPGEFSVCFTELQERFFNNLPRKLKDLILLVKYWYQQCQEKLPVSFQLPVYALELLTVYAWEQGCGAEDFDIAEGLRTVLGLIRKPGELCVYWTVNYNFEDETVRNVLLGQLRARRPVILDPTDPTNNVSQDNSCWHLLKLEAETWLSFLNESPGPSWNVLPASLYSTPSHHLDKFIKDFLQPDKTFLDQTKKAVDIICKFLKENCFRHSATKVQKIVKGGSTAKGTALKNSDADLVVFTDLLKSYTSQKNERCTIIKEIHKQLEACQQAQDFEVTFEISKWKAPRVLSFSLKSKVLNECVHFDVLPAFNALGDLKSGSAPSPKIYAELISLYKSSDILGGEFSTCFTKLQRDFVRSQPTKLKDLIRLVDLHLRGPESGSCPFRWQVHRQAAGTERGKLAAQGVLLKASPAASLTCHCPDGPALPVTSFRVAPKRGADSWGWGQPAKRAGHTHLSQSSTSTQDTCCQVYLLFSQVLSPQVPQTVPGHSDLHSYTSFFLPFFFFFFFCLF